MSTDVEWKPELEHGEFVDHPIRLYESNVLSMVRSPAMDEGLIRHICKRGTSTFQIETVLRAFQSLLLHRCFMIADGTGSGKGRVLAALAKTMHCYNKCTVIWVSANQRMKKEVIRDMVAVGASEKSIPKWVVFCSFQTLKGECEQIRRQEFGRPDNILLIVDESHMLRNSNINIRVIDNLCNTISTRVCYSSATPASSVAHLQYWKLFNIWGYNKAFQNFSAFSKALNLCGTSGLELVISKLKSDGKFVSRHIERMEDEVTLQIHNVDAEQRLFYDVCVMIMRRAGVFGGIAHQTFFKRLITSFKVKTALKMIEEALTQGRSVVVTVQDTGNACQQRNVNHSDPQFSCSALDMLKKIAGHLPELPWPLDPIDAIIDHFGADNVAEITGRSHRVVRRGDKKLVYESKGSTRHHLERFQEEKVHIAVMSKAGSTGIGLHCLGNRPRTHVFLELPWDAETFYQCQGRCHRAGSLSSPHIMLIESDVPCEQRFVSGLRNKLRGLSALSHGDQASMDAPVSNFTSDINANTRRELSARLIFTRIYHWLDRPKSIEIPAKYHSINPCLSRDIVTIYENIQQGYYTYEKCVEVMGMIADSYPRHRLWIGEKWSFSSHHLFGASTRRTVESIWKLSYEEDSLIATLSPDLISHICCMLTRSVEIDDVLYLETQLRHQHLSVPDIMHLGSSSLFNRSMGLTLKAQHFMTKLLKDAEETETKCKHSIFHEYLLHNHAFCNINLKCTWMQAAQDGRVLVNVQATLRESKAVRPGPPYHMWGGTLCKVYHKDTHVEILRCGEEICYKTISGDEWYATERTEINDCEAWINFERQKRTRLSRAISRLCGVYVFETSNAIERWNQSTGKVLRVQPPLVEASQSFVGLLMCRLPKAAPS